MCVHAGTSAVQEDEDGQEEAAEDDTLRRSRSVNCVSSGSGSGSSTTKPKRASKKSRACATRSNSYPAVSARRY